MLCWKRRNPEGARFSLAWTRFQFMDSQGLGDLTGEFSRMIDRRATDNGNSVANSFRTGCVGSANSAPRYEGRAVAGSVSNGFCSSPANHSEQHGNNH